jgi:[FeFe] hydrogenase H-cluster maturation GTPase HydF
VSAEPGTTTDPVEKPMELQPLGPVLFIDTAGLDDEGGLGGLRIERSAAVIERTDLAILVTDAQWTPFEAQLAERFRARKLAFVVVFNKSDQQTPDAELLRALRREMRVEQASAVQEGGVEALRRALSELVPDEYVQAPPILADLVGPGELAVFVVPIDKEAPKGRLILPQVQAIRDLLDHDAMALVVKERELRLALERLKTPPRLVVTDSQAFLKVAADTPDEIPLTSFSILFARLKGELESFVSGAKAIETLRDGDKILVAESCAHHPIGEDIGRVKIPRWLSQYSGAELSFSTVQGADFPDDLSPYRMVVHCGACMTNRRAMLNRIRRCEEQGVAISNYGIVIAYSLGIFERALRPFPAAHELAMRAVE